MICDPAPRYKACQDTQKDRAAYLIIVSLTSLYMLPQIANCKFVNSDIAIVGLQALHMLRGEWTPFLWSNIYQGALYPTIAAAGFAVFGPTGIWLFASSFVGYLVMAGKLLNVSIICIISRRLLSALRGTLGPPFTKSVHSCVDPNTCPLGDVIQGPFA